MVKKIGIYLLIILFFAYILSICIIFFISPDKETSYYENRTLAQAPVKNIHSFLSGEFTRNYEDYFIDQFVGRDYWVKAYKTAEFMRQENWVARIRSTDPLAIETAAGDGQPITRSSYADNVKLIDGFHITPDGWIMAEPVTYYPEEGMIEAARQLNELSQHLNQDGIEFFFTFFPNKLEAVTLDFPEDRVKGRLVENKEFLIERIDTELIPIIDASNYFSETFTPMEINELYFRTDHHWNMSGAFQGYKFFINEMDKLSKYELGKVSIDHYYISCLEDIDFMGSWNRQIYGLVKYDENVCYYHPIDENKQFHHFQVYEGPISIENLKSWDEIYASGLHKEELIVYSDAYTTDYRELNIINDRNDGKPNILIIKDSYTNPISFHIANHFYKTTIYDMRHNGDRTLYEFLEENDYDIVTVMYNDKIVTGEMFDFK